tara:strand:+ start:22278 stop:24830 length:2553 start_codon:yes stop_codon:yes gene_type:complete
MKRILLILAGIFGLLVVAALVVPFLVPKDVYKAQIEKAATGALQRDVTLTGAVKISVFPRIAASVGGVTVANPEGFDRPYMIEAGELRGSVKWLPLLSGRVDVQEISFVGAKVDLHKLADGTSNWEFGAKKSEPDADTGEAGVGFDAGVASARLRNASLTYRDDASGASYDLKELDMQASLQSLDQPLDLEASGLIQGETFDMVLRLDSPNALSAGAPANANFALESSLGDASYEGGVTLGDAPSLSGAFTAGSDALGKLVAFTGTELAMDVTQLGKLDTRGTVSGDLTAPAITFETLTLKGALIDANYTGGVKIGEAISLDGSFAATLPLAGDLATQLGIDLPASDALERVEIKGALNGALDALKLSALDVKHTGALLNATYAGEVGLGGDGRVNGRLTASSDELRALLKAADVEMAPGETLKAFDVKSAVAGSFKTLSLTDLTMTLDGITGAGTAGVDLSGERPKLTGNLAMGPLDLSPFLGEGNQAEKPKQAGTGWSKEPLDLGGLNALDADVQITTSALTIGKVKLTDAALSTRLDKGVLAADLSRFKAFGGDWNGKLGVNARGETPALDFTMNGSGVGMSSLLGTLAGFDKLTGTGGFTVTGAASGNSMNDIMNALDGKVTTNLSDGALKGLNVAQLVRSASSLQQALTSGNLASLDVSQALSPSAETDFSRFDTVLTITDGVANVDLMKLINPVLGIDGSGKINLGGQALDLRLATSIDKAGTGSGSVVQLNGIPVPVRVSGTWSNLKVSPDTSGIQAALKAELGNKLKDQLGGEAGAILGNVLGVPATPDKTGAPDSADPATAQPEETAPVTLEDAAEEAARNALGDLFGNKKKKEPAPAEPE